MKRILLLAFCIFALPVLASHIVGGEFEIIHISGNMYRVNMILYFDVHNGNPGAKDNEVRVRIFRKKDNTPVLTLTLPKISETHVSYTQPECSVGDLETEKIIYSTQLGFSDALFSDPEGYYIAWERCCRNYGIDNVYSEDPATGPAALYAGQTFYLEFPPIVKNGQPFYNSTPRLFPPLSDYGCPGRKYYVDFAGVDDDGDSLVYSLVTPLNTLSSHALPPTGPPGFEVPRPGPYPNVQWRPGFSLSNITGGNPDLAISEDGFLTITPRQPPPPTGPNDDGDLLVFAVKAEEFRDGVKIGEVRRDFQMLVLNSCPIADPPQILGKTLAQSTYTFDENMTVSFANTVSDDDRCIEVQVSDPDALKLSDAFKEKVSIRAVALNFKKNISDILPEVTNATLLNGSVQEFRICFDKCPYIIGSPYLIGIVAYDDACALPLSDTLKISVMIEPPPNQEPYFTTPNVLELVNEGIEVNYPIKAVDADGDPLVIAIANDGFALANVGMTLNVNQFSPGLYDATLNWDSKCDVYDFTKKSSFELKFTVEDEDQCKVPAPEIMTLKLQVKLPGNADPIISTDLTAEQIANGVERKIFENMNFNVFGKDTDGDYLILNTTGLGYNMAAYGMTSPQDTGNGNVDTHYNWDLLCNQMNLDAKDAFDVRFIVVDNANKCRFYKADTLDIKVKVLPPDNEKPVLTVTNMNPSLTMTNNEQSLFIGQQISLALNSNDPYVAPSQDHIRIELIDATGNVQPSGYIFAPAEGNGSAATTFVWETDCAIFEDGVYENNYTFKFRTFDDRCFSMKADTVEVKFNIRDVDGSDTEFVPPNVITPNGDGCNDFFAMEALEDLSPCNGDGEITLPNLPKDNCVGRFVEVFIYNRWGREIYTSGQRNFRWYPNNEAAGVYFYTLKYSHKEYKGTIHLRN